MEEQYVRLRDAGRFDEAARTAERLVALAERSLAPRLHHLPLPKLAEIRSHQGQMREALAIYEKCYALCQRAKSQTERERIDVVRCAWISLRGMGVCLDSLGRHEQALSRTEEALEFCRLNLDAFSTPQVTLAQSQADLAVEYVNRAQWQKAEPLLQEAVGSLEKLLRAGPDPSIARSVLAHALGQSARIDKSGGRFDLAEPKLRRALQLRAAAHGWQHSETGMTLYELGALYGTQRRWPEAEAYLRASLDAWKSSGGLEDIGAASTISALGRCVAEQGRFTEAEPLLRQAAEICERKGGRTSRQTVKALEELAYLLGRLRRYQEAETLLRETLVSIESVDGVGHPHTADTLSDLAWLRHLQSDYERAIEQWTQAEQIYNQDPLAKRRLLNVYKGRAYALWELRRADEAIEQLELAITGIEA